MRASSERGFTLIELMIAVTLVALISAGMLMAMRTSLLTYQKTGDRLEANRRAINVEQILAREIGGLMPVSGNCPAGQGPGSPMSFFRGTETTLHLVSSFSIAQGARGNPQILEFQVVPLDNGAVRLVVNEIPYTGPASMMGLCQNRFYRPVPVGPSSFVLADNLAFCRISYHEPYDDVFTPVRWLPVWNQDRLPSGIRIDMAPMRPEPGGLPVIGMTVPIRVNRDVMIPYAQ